MTDSADHLAPDSAYSGNRKLIRPRLSALMTTRPPLPRNNEAQQQPLRRAQHTSPISANAAAPVIEPSHAEVFYFQKQVQAQTPMVVVLDDGEQLNGIIEWFDRDSLKLRLTTLQRVLVYKSAIKFIYKLGEASAAD